METPVNQKVDI